MNFDLITKLAKLANNNPNENEANLAARKVCRLLAEGEFKFTNDSGTLRDKNGNPIYQPSQKQQEYHKNPSMDYVYEYMRQRARSGPRDKWYDGPPPYAYKSPFYSSYWDSPKQPKWPGDEPFKKPSESQFYTDPATGKRVHKNEERLLKCRTCKNTKLTRFVGLAELYECNTCQWTAYEAKAKNK